jgi:hypothetical protein
VSTLMHCLLLLLPPLLLLLLLLLHIHAPVSTLMHCLLCQFQVRMVWSSLADTIQGYSLWNCTVRM